MSDIDYRPFIDNEKRDSSSSSTYSSASSISSTSSVKTPLLSDIQKLSSSFSDSDFASFLGVDISGRVKSVMKEVNDVIDFIHDKVYDKKPTQDVDKDISDAIENSTSDSRVLEPILVILNITDRYVDDMGRCLEELTYLAMLAKKNKPTNSKVEGIVSGLYTQKLNEAFAMSNMPSEYNSMIVSINNVLGITSMYSEAIALDNSALISLTQERLPSSLEGLYKSYRYSVSSNRHSIELAYKAFNLIHESNGDINNIN